jgi:putative transposase
MSTLTERSRIIALVGQALEDGARQDRACGAISLSERTLQRWQRGQSRGDQRPIRVQAPKNALSAQERQAVLAVAQSDEFGHLCPGQIVPRLADQGKYIASESTFHRVLRAANQLQHEAIWPSVDTPCGRGCCNRPDCRAALGSGPPKPWPSWPITSPRRRSQTGQLSG